LIDVYMVVVEVVEVVLTCGSTNVCWVVWPGNWY